LATRERALKTFIFFDLVIVLLGIHPKKVIREVEIDLWSRMLRLTLFMISQSQDRHVVKISSVGKYNLM
jgi:hypothetical protein